MVIEKSRLEAEAQEGLRKKNEALLKMMEELEFQFKRALKELNNIKNKYEL